MSAVHTTNVRHEPRRAHLITNKAARAARILHKQNTVLEWLAGEPYSTAQILANVLELGRNATWKTLGAMHRAGLVRPEQVQMPLAGALSLWVLTAHGAVMGSPIDGGAPLPYFESGRIAPSTIEHGLDVQRARLAARRAGWNGWQGDLVLHRAANAEKWRKVPDAIAVSPAGETAAVEVERTAKTRKRYEGIMAEYLQMIRAGLVARVHYVCAVPGLAPRLAGLFNGIEAVPVGGKRWEVTPEHRARFEFYSLDNWPPTAAKEKGK